MDRAAPQAVGERLLALVTPQPASQRIVRRAWRSAQRLGAELDVLIVLAREPSEAEREQIEAFHRLASLLGAQVLVEEGDDVAEVAARVARERRSTYVLIGTPAPRRGPAAGSRSRSRTGSCARCRASTCGSSPIAPSGSGRHDERDPARARRGRRGRARSSCSCAAATATEAPAPTRRILFPYVGTQLSISALDAALRIARVENATLVPAYLAPVPMSMPLEAPIPRTCGRAFELQEAIEQRAAAAGVPVDGAHRPRPHGPPRAPAAARGRALRPHRRRRRDRAHRRPQRRRRGLAARARARRGRRAPAGRRGRARGARERHQTVSHSSS